jgi:hypothetical protein
MFVEPMILERYAELHIIPTKIRLKNNVLQKYTFFYESKGVLSNQNKTTLT